MRNRILKADVCLVKLDYKTMDNQLATFQDQVFREIQ